MPIPGIYQLAQFLGTKKRKRKATEGLDQMILNLQAQAGPTPSPAQQNAMQRQDNPLLQMLAGDTGPAPQQSPISTGQLDPKIQALIERANTLKTGQGPVQAFNYLQQATDPATASQRQVSESRGSDAMLATRQLQERDAAQQEMMERLNAGATKDMPPMLQALAGSPTGRAAIGTQTPKAAGASILSSMGIPGQGARIPSSVQEHRYYLSLSESQRKEYLRVKRAAQIIDMGGGASSILDPDNQLKTLVTATETGDNAATAKRLERIGVALGDKQGAEQAGLGESYEVAKRGVDTIDALRHHPGLTKSTGALVLNPQKLAPGTDAHNFGVLLDQVTGQVFATAYSTLKGSGHITEFESESVAKGIARLKSSQSQAEFKRGLDDLETLILNIYAGQRRRAAGDFQTPADPRTQPSTISAGGRSRAEVLKQYGVAD